MVWYGMVIIVAHGCAEEGQIEPPGMHLGLGPWLLRFVRFVTFCSSEAVRAPMNCGKWRPGKIVPRTPPAGVAKDSGAQTAIECGIVWPFLSRSPKPRNC